MTQRDEILSVLGLCAKAGKLIYGTPMVCESLSGKQKPILVLTAKNNSENTDKKIRDKCGYYGTDTRMLDTDGETLAQAVGKTGHLSCVALSDENFVKLLNSKWNATEMANGK